MQTEKAIKLLSPLLCAYPAAKITADTIQVYAIALSGLSEQELSAAVLKCMRICKFFPSIAEIMEESRTMVEVATGTQSKGADEAWKEVQEQMQIAFIYSKPKFSTPEIEQAAQSMGWNNLCQTETDAMGTARAQFRGMYEAICKRKKETKINNEVFELAGIVKETAKLLPGVKL